MLKQIDDGLSSLQIGENERSSGSAPSEDTAPLDKVRPCIHVAP